MSDFLPVKTWVDANLRNNINHDHLTKDKLLELQAFADNEVESLSKRVEHAMINYQRDDQIQALSSITLNNFNPNASDPLENAFSVVLLKAAPFSTDGVFVIIQSVPNQYIMRTIIRTDKEYKVLGVTHTFLCFYKSDKIKPTIMTGTLNGDCQTKIFELKDKIDNGQEMEEVIYGTNDPFTITLPNGEVVEP